MDSRTELCIRDVKMRIVHLKGILNPREQRDQRKRDVHRAEKKPDEAQGDNFRGH